MEKLDNYDRAICHVFANKVSTHTTDAAYKKVPFAFKTDSPLPTLRNLHSRTTFISGFESEYVGPHANLRKCLFCNEDWFREDGKPHKWFTYILLIPQLKAFALNSKLATTMKYPVTSQILELSQTFLTAHITQHYAMYVWRSTTRYSTIHIFQIPEMCALAHAIYEEELDVHHRWVDMVIAHKIDLKHDPMS